MSVWPRAAHTPASEGTPVALTSPHPPSVLEKTVECHPVVSEGGIQKLLFVMNPCADAVYVKSLKILVF